MNKEMLAQFTGSNTRFRTLLRRVLYTEGVAFLAEEAGAYWLIDAIASYFISDEMRKAFQKDPRTKQLQFWRLEVSEECTATLKAYADSDEEPFIIQEIPYTDFPLPAIDIWAGFDGTYWTLYLPSEH